MAVFTDNFTDTSGTDLSSHSPSGGVGSWAVGTGGGITIHKISSANRARTNGTGVSISVESVSPSTTEYTVQCGLVPLTLPTDGLYWVVGSHADTGDTGKYLAGLITASGEFRATIALMTSGSTFTNQTSIAGAGFSIGVTYTFKLITALSGANLIVSAECQRSSDSKWLKSDGTWQTGEITYASFTDTSPLSTRKGSLASFDFGGDAVGVHFDDFVIPTPTLDQGVATITSSSPTSVSFSATDATGGTAPYSYQWQRSIDAVSWSDLAGKTSLTGTDSTVVAGTEYFYRLTYTDSAAGTAHSLAVPVAPWGAPIVLGIIGDSKSTGTGGTDIYPQVASLWSKVRVSRTVTVGSNQAVSGSNSTDWALSGSHDGDAVTAFAANSVTHVVIDLGTNDGNLATYLSNMAAIVAGWVGRGYKVILDAPSYTLQGDAQVAIFWGMQAGLDHLCNGTTILPGDRKAFNYIAANQSLLVDGVHYTTTGKARIAELKAAAYDRAVNADFAGGSGVGGSLLLGV